MPPPSVTCTSAVAICHKLTPPSNGSAFLCHLYCTAATQSDYGGGWAIGKPNRSIKSHRLHFDSLRCCGTSTQTPLRTTPHPPLLSPVPQHPRRSNLSHAPHSVPPWPLSMLRPPHSRPSRCFATGHVHETLSTHISAPALGHPLPEHTHATLPELASRRVQAAPAQMMCSPTANAATDH